jgi:predicted permease
LGRVLVGCQVALSVLLLVGAGLFVRTLQNLANQDIGFNADRLLQVSIDTRFAGYDSRRRGGAGEQDREGEVGKVYRQLIERVSAVPGVRSVSGVRNPLLRGGSSRMAVRISGLEPGRDEMWLAADVGPAFFETMGIPVVRGRTFTTQDFESQNGSYVINEAFARHYFPNADPLTRAPNIIGIVRDVKLFAVRAGVEPMMYAMFKREPDRINSLMVRTAGDPAAVSGAIREAIQGVNPRLFSSINTVDEEIARGIARERMVAAISAVFSGLGIILASVGIFGVASSTVAQRTTELGIRRALGAGRWAMIRETLRETMIVAGLGLAVGALAAFAAVRLTASLIADLLFGLTATDAATIVGAVLLMIVVAGAACVVPARHATRIDPIQAIRRE